MLIWGRFGVDLGSLLGVTFAPLGAFFRLSWSPKLVQEASSNRLIFDKVIVHEIVWGQCFSYVFGDVTAPNGTVTSQKREGCV